MEEKSAHLFPSEQREAMNALFAVKDLAQFWKVAVKLLQHAVPHHTAFMWCDYFDFAKTSKSTVIFEHPNHKRTPDYWEGRRRHHLTAAYLSSHAGIKYYRMGDVVPLAKIRASEFYRRFMQPEGWEYAVTVAFWERDILRATIALYRTADQGDATFAEQDALSELHAALQGTLFRILDQLQEQAMHLCIEDIVQGLPAGLIILDWELRPVFVNQEGYNLALAWNKGVEAAKVFNAKSCFAVPPGLRRLCETLRTDWLEHLVPGRRPAELLSKRLNHPEFPSLRAVVSTQNVHTVSPTRPCFVIRLSGLSVQSKLSFRPNERQFDLLSLMTNAEREVALLVTEGLRNDEIAKRLNKQTSTIKYQLRSVYDKLEARGRTHLASLLRGGAARQG
jgi:DNA-binding CsgD family transcriptional regulator